MDKICRMILNDLISQGQGTEFVYGLSETGKYFYGTSIDTLSEKLNLSVDTVKSAIRYLEAENYVEYKVMHSNKGANNAGVCLSYKGLNWKYFHRKEVLNYIADKWVDFFAAVISLISLIISVIAIARQ